MHKPLFAAPLLLSPTLVIAPVLTGYHNDLSLLLKKVSKLE